MKIKTNDIDINKIGIYCIKNIITKNVYIGSTTQSFLIRYSQHVYELIHNKHKNKYLQNSFNKYGADNFLFIIIESCNKDTILEREQFFIDKNYKLFNINKKATGTYGMPKEVIEKRSNTFKITQNEAMKFYYKLKNKEISVIDIPEKYKRMVISRINTHIWNKGITKKDCSYNHLKGIKKNNSSEKYLNGRKNAKEKMRNKSKIILVFDINNKLLFTFNCIEECVSYLNNHYEEIPMILRNKNGRSGLHPKYISRQNVSNVLHKKMKSYKGLKFEFK